MKQIFGEVGGKGAGRSLLEWPETGHQVTTLDRAKLTERLGTLSEDLLIIITQNPTQSSTSAHAPVQHSGDLAMTRTEISESWSQNPPDRVDLKQK